MGIKAEQVLLVLVLDSRYIYKLYIVSTYGAIQIMKIQGEVPKLWCLSEKYKYLSAYCYNNYETNSVPSICLSKTDFILPSSVEDTF